MWVRKIHIPHVGAHISLRGVASGEAASLRYFRKPEWRKQSREGGYLARSPGGIPTRIARDLIEIVALLELGIPTQPHATKTSRIRSPAITVSILKIFTPPLSLRSVFPELYKPSRCALWITRRSLRRSLQSSLRRPLPSRCALSAEAPSGGSLGASREAPQTCALCANLQAHCKNRPGAGFWSSIPPLGERRAAPCPPLAWDRHSLNTAKMFRSELHPQLHPELHPPRLDPNRPQMGTSLGFAPSFARGVA